MGYYRRHIILVTALLLCGVFATATNSRAQDVESYDNRSAVILSYHRIGEDRFPETSIRVSQFQEHIGELVNEVYSLRSLDRLVSDFKNEEPIMARAVSLTFDGGHKSFLEHAWPLLKEYMIPATIFISTDLIDRQSEEYLSWSDLRMLKRHHLITIGIHPAGYTRLHDHSPQDIRYQINKALGRYREELKSDPDFFAYPFGEMSHQYYEIVRAYDFAAALGQNSGAAHFHSDLYNLPRFVMTENYGNLDRFRQAIQSRPLPVTDISPADMLVDSDTTPRIGFTLAQSLADKADQLSCFISGQTPPHIERLGGGRVEIRPQAPFNADRTRMNCTIPVQTTQPGEDPAWRWFGMLFVTNER